MKEIKNIIGDNLISTIKYNVGFIENFLFVLKDIDILALDKIKPFNKSNYLFLTEESILNGVDVFPLEFYNIKTNYKVLQGEDIIKKLKFDKEHIRRELEFQFRSKLINLRQEYLNLKERQLKNLIFAAIPALTPMLKGMAFLKNLKTDDKDLIEKVSKAYDEDLSILKQIEEIKSKNEKIKDEEDFIQRLITLLENLSNKLDSLS